MDTIQIKSFVDEVEKIKEATGTLGHAAEVAGLGILAKPSIDKLRGKKTTEKSDHAHELAGLGVLAAPSAAHLGHSAWQAGKKLLKRASVEKTARGFDRAERMKDEARAGGVIKPPWLRAEETAKDVKKSVSAVRATGRMVKTAPKVGILGQIKKLFH
jgi:hypothetical protein